ncbi:hypothetical protein FACS189415_5530 [Bacteroidia bacterium]|nr:hypothetical protein FACS189415_5530 [Bacteroidia bacterium]
MQRMHGTLSSSKKMSLGAMVTSLSLVLLYVSNLWSTGRMAAIFIMAFLPCVLIIERGRGAAFICYMATSLLGLLLMPSKLSILPYVAAFGYYGLVKDWVEDRVRHGIQWLLKLLALDVGGALWYVAAMYLFLGQLELPWGVPLWLAALIAQPVLLAADWLLGQVVDYYVAHLRRWFMRG